MKIRQWEILKSRPTGFQRDHGFIILSAQERCDREHNLHVNGLACFTLRGQPAAVDIVLDSADGFQGPPFAPAISPLFWKRRDFIPASDLSPGNGNNRSNQKSSNCSIFDCDFGCDFKLGSAAGRARTPLRAVFWIAGSGAQRSARPTHDRTHGDPHLKSQPVKSL